LDDELMRVSVPAGSLIEVRTSGVVSCWSSKGGDALVSAIEELSDLDMPPDEIAAMVQAQDPQLVRRYLELHRERLEERLADQVRTLERLERLLTATWERLRH
jgi:DNA-binding transcriptional MerR regulator